MKGDKDTYLSMSVFLGSLRRKGIERLNYCHCQSAEPNTVPACILTEMSALITAIKVFIISASIITKRGQDFKKLALERQSDVNCCLTYRYLSPHTRNSLR